MALSYYFYSLGVIPLFTSRAFMPIFATALTARFGPEFDYLANLSGIQLMTSLPNWATSDMTLLVLGVMAAVELITNKIPEARLLLTVTDTKAKAIAGFIVCFFLVGGSSVELIDIVEKEGITTDFQSGQSFAYIWAFIIGSIVWIVAKLREAVFGFLSEIDEDDNLGLQKLLSWMEDGIGFVGVIFVVIFPIIALMITTLTMLGLYLLKRYLEAREEKKKVPCTACNTMNYPCGTACLSCNEPNKNILKVGLLGTIKDQAVRDIETHRFQLLACKRCTLCGNRLKEKNINQICTACSTKPFKSKKEVEKYLGGLRSRLPKTLVVCFGFSFIPILGLIPGIIYYKLNLISGLIGWVPRSSSIFLRWGVRVINILLICLQPVPILGAITLPLMGYTNYSIYQGSIRRMSAKAFI